MAHDIKATKLHVNEVSSEEVDKISINTPLRYDQPNSYTEDGDIVDKKYVDNMVAGAGDSNTLRDVANSKTTIYLTKGADIVIGGGSGPTTSVYSGNFVNNLIKDQAVVGSTFVFIFDQTNTNTGEYIQVTLSSPDGTDSVYVITGIKSNEISPNVPYEFIFKTTSELILSNSNYFVKKLSFTRTISNQETSFFYATSETDGIDFFYDITTDAAIAIELSKPYAEYNVVFLATNTGAAAVQPRLRINGVEIGPIGGFEVESSVIPGRSYQIINWDSTFEGNGCRVQGAGLYISRLNGISGINGAVENYALYPLNFTNTPDDVTNKNNYVCTLSGLVPTANVVYNFKFDVTNDHFGGSLEDQPVIIINSVNYGQILDSFNTGELQADKVYLFVFNGTNFKLAPDDRKYAVIDGYNTFQGNQSITGGLEMAGALLVALGIEVINNGIDVKNAFPVRFKGINSSSILYTQTLNADEPNAEDANFLMPKNNNYGNRLIVNIDGVTADEEGHVTTFKNYNVVIGVNTFTPTGILAAMDNFSDALSTDNPSIAIYSWQQIGYYIYISITGFNVLPASLLENNTQITYFLDLWGQIKNVGNLSLANATNLVDVKLPGALTYGVDVFDNSSSITSLTSLKNSTAIQELEVANSITANILDRKPSYRTITAATTIVVTDYTINVTSGTFSQPLPTTTLETGQIINIKNSGAGTITITATSIDGAGSITANPGENKVLQYTGVSNTYITL